MLKLYKNLKKEEWCMIAVSLIFIVLQVWLDLTMPEYMADIAGLVQTPGCEMGDILAADPAGNGSAYGEQNVLCHCPSAFHDQGCGSDPCHEGRRYH